MTAQTKPKRGWAGFLSDEQVREIRRLHDGGGAYKGYANRLGVSDQMARLIAQRKSYRQVPEAADEEAAGNETPPVPIKNDLAEDCTAWRYS